MTNEIAPLTEAQLKVGRTSAHPGRLSTKDKDYLRKAVEIAFQNAGGVTYLENLAFKQPKVFCALLGKCMPQRIDVPEDTAIKIEIVRFGKEKNPQDLL